MPNRLATFPRSALLTSFAFLSPTQLCAPEAAPLGETTPRYRWQKWALGPHLLRLGRGKRAITLILTIICQSQRRQALLQLAFPLTDLSVSEIRRGVPPRCQFLQCAG